MKIKKEGERRNKIERGKRATKKEKEGNERGIENKERRKDKEKEE